jgi:serine/threonine-protein kinase HipA
MGALSGLRSALCRWPRGEHATAIDGEGRHPTAEHILNVAAKVGLNRRRANKIIDEVSQAVTAKLSGFLRSAQK